MVIVLQFSFTEQTAIITVEDFFALAEIGETFQALYSHPLHRAGMDELWDFRKATLENASNQEILNKSTMLRKHIKKSSERTAFVVANDLMYGLISIWNAYADTILRKDRRIFRSYKSAYNWLISERVNHLVNSQNDSGAVYAG